MPSESTTINQIISGSFQNVDDVISIRYNYINGEENLLDLQNQIDTDFDHLSPDEKLSKQVLAFWVSGNFSQIISSYEGVTPDGLNRDLLAHSYLSIQEYALAIETLGSVDTPNPFQASIAIDAYAALHKYDELEAVYSKLIDNAPADNLYVRYCEARVKEANHDYEIACDIYSEIIEIEPKFHLASFRLACIFDQYNENEKAINLYLKSVPYGYTPAFSLVNLGLLFEDEEHYAKAIDCFEKALTVDPSNLIARLHLSNSVGSQNMVFDEKKDQEKKTTEKILNVPVSDFELSVRSRNCLSKMNILTLGDLVNRTEEDLLSYKNFGETSLKEIKEMLSQRGLGLKSNKEDDLILPEASSSPVTSESTTGTPIENLSISLRSRKCLERLGLNHLEEITRYSKEDLMAIRNFGQTSLDEISELLTLQGLHLKP